MSERDEYSDMFRFPIGTCVRWAEFPRTRYYIYQRRWTEREILDPVVQYRFRASKTGAELGGLGHEWVSERDIEAWPEDAP